MEPPPSDPPALPVNPMAIALPDAARLLSAAGNGRITEEMLRIDVQAGAPVHGDGTINLLHYAAWLVAELAGNGD